MSVIDEIVGQITRLNLLDRQSFGLRKHCEAGSGDGAVEVYIRHVPARPETSVKSATALEIGNILFGKEKEAPKTPEQRKLCREIVEAIHKSNPLCETRIESVEDDAFAGWLLRGYWLPKEVVLGHVLGFFKVTPAVLGTKRYVVCTYFPDAYAATQEIRESEVATA